MLKFSVYFQYIEESANSVVGLGVGNRHPDPVFVGKEAATHAWEASMENAQVIESSSTCEPITSLVRIQLTEIKSAFKRAICNPKFMAANSQQQGHGINPETCQQRTRQRNVQGLACWFNG